MIRHFRAFLVLCSLLAFWPVVAQATVATSVNFTPPAKASDNHPKIAGRLLASSQLVSSGLKRANAHGEIKLLVKAFLTQPLTAPLRDRLQQSGYQLTVAPENARQVEGLLPASRLAVLEAMPEIRFLQQPATARPQVGKASNAGVTILHASELNALGLTGAGVRVGVISDGVTGLAVAKIFGDLPDVTVVSNSCVPANVGDCAEGTAMLEIVHDMAPSASLGFCGAFTELSVGDCLDKLVSQFHADIVVDDLSSPDEPMFEDGPVAKDVDAKAAAGIQYVSAAANNFGCNYESDFYPFPESAGGYDASHDFGQQGGGATNTNNQVLIPPGGTLEAILQWNDPYETSTNDYDLFIHTNDTVLASSTNTQNGSTAPAYENATYVNKSGSPVSAYVSVLRTKGAQSRHFKLSLNDGSSGCDGISPIAYTTPQFGGIYGHAAARGAITVAALDSLTPDILQPFSARGPVRLDFPTLNLRPKPDISAVDNVGVSGVGGFGASGTCGSPVCFVGTSAAAPQVAGVLALLGGFSGDHRSAIMSTAVSLGDPSKFGAGRVNALAAARLLNQAPASQIVNPSGNTQIEVGQSVSFLGICTDPEKMTGKTVSWSFGADSGLTPSTQSVPGSLVFAKAGVFTVAFGCRDGFGKSAPLVTRVVTVSNPPAADSGGGGGGGSMDLPVLLGLTMLTILRRKRPDGFCQQSW